LETGNLAFNNYAYSGLTMMRGYDEVMKNQVTVVP